MVSALFYFVSNVSAMYYYSAVHSVIAVVVVLKEIVCDVLILYSESSCRPMTCDSARLISDCFVYTLYIQTVNSVYPLTCCSKNNRLKL